MNYFQSTKKEAGGTATQTVLWSNSDVTQPFSQTSITLNESANNYDELRIVLLKTNTDSNITANQYATTWRISDLNQPYSKRAFATCLAAATGEYSSYWTRGYRLSTNGEILVCEPAVAEKGDYTHGEANYIGIPVEIVGIKY